jgi:hypothetical protein
LPGQRNWTTPRGVYLVCIWITGARRVSAAKCSSYQHVRGDLVIIDFLPLFMFITLMTSMFTSYPIGFVLGGTSVLFGLIGAAFGIFSFIEFFNFVPRI